MPARKSKDNAAGTLAWLVERYRETTAWTSLALETRQRRENILLTMLDSAGHQPFTRITKAAIVAGRERRTPFQAKHFMDTVRGLFRWAVDAGLAKVDPTAGVAYPKLPDSDGFPPWTRGRCRALRKAMADRHPRARMARRACSIPACAGVTPCGWASSTFATASPPSRRRRPEQRSRCRSCPCWQQTLSRRSMRRSRISSPARAGKPLQKALVRQCLCCRGSQGWHQGKVGARLTQAWRDPRGECRRDCRAARRPIFGWNRRSMCFALYPRRRSPQAGDRRNGEACERVLNILFPHLCPRCGNQSK